MAFSINTNIASLQAQDYLRVTSDFQQKTINRVTSGLRIVSSGDDAAGLAIANGFRSDLAVLSQGVRNANDGLSTLQTIDGGMNNISKLLDRARTLATQSASGTFTGDRGVLNSEFKSVIDEIDRQAQAIGLNTGGDFAKKLAVFVGGGKGSDGDAQVTNGSVSVDLSSSTVDAKSLGLKGMQAVGATANLSSSSDTSVSKIISDNTNKASLAQSGYTEFNFSGAGFSDSGKINVSVNLSGVTDLNTLAEAINDGIQTAGNGGSSAATAFKNVGISASVSSDGKQIVFTSATNAFQVQAGDRMANAFLGNVTSSSNPTGKDISSTVVAAATSGGSSPADFTMSVQIRGAGLSTTKTISLTGADEQAVLDSLYTQVSADADLKAAGITVNQATAGSDSVTFTSATGEYFEVTTSGDADNVLGFGAAPATWAGSTAAATSGARVNAGGIMATSAFDFTGISDSNDSQAVTFTATDANGTMHSTEVKLTSTNAATIDQAVSAINTALQKTNDSTLDKLVAVAVGNAEDKHIQFMGTGDFSVSLGTAGVSGSTAGIGASGDQAKVHSASSSGTGSTADISTQDNAKKAVTALADAVETLGTAQAVVGKGQNQFNYAINLAQTQISNIAAAESRIRDADLASEAANLTKAQILQQAGLAALAQANSAPQAVLSLLRG